MKSPLLIVAIALVSGQAMSDEPSGRIWNMAPVQQTSNETPWTHPANWHLLTVTHGGTFSLLKDLTKRECDFIRARALGLPATEEEQKAEDERRREIAEYRKKCLDDLSSGKGRCLIVGDSTGYVITSDRIKSAECFQ